MESKALHTGIVGSAVILEPAKHVHLVARVWGPCDARVYGERLGKGWRAQGPCRPLSVSDWSTAGLLHLKRLTILTAQHLSKV